MSCTFHSDPTLTTDNVAEVMELLNYWNSLVKGHQYVGSYIISSNRLKEIQGKCSTKKEIANECASSYVHCHPHPSWTHLANYVYSWGEFVVVEKLKPFLPLRGKYQINSYAGMSHTLQACAVYVFCHGWNCNMIITVCDKLLLIVSLCSLVDSWCAWFH